MRTHESGGVGASRDKILLAQDMAKGIFLLGSRTTFTNIFVKHIIVKTTNFSKGEMGHHGSKAEVDRFSNRHDVSQAVSAFIY